MPPALPATLDLPLEVGQVDCRLADLRRRVESFDGCAELRAQASRVVFGDGVVEARLMVIGEAPGADEDRVGLPFVGRSGKLLRKLLGEAGFVPAEIYITNTVFWRPPNNRPPTGQELAECLPFLREHVEIVGPQVLLLAGATAARAVLGVEGAMGALRNVWHGVRIGERVVPARVVFHPAYLLRNPPATGVVREDLALVRAKIA